MATEYLQNGNFKDGLENWKAPIGFDPHFEPYSQGQSVRLEPGDIIKQAIVEFANKTLHVEFDVRSDTETADEVFFTFALSGYNSEGNMDVSPVFGFATAQWKHYSGSINFQTRLKNCLLTASAPQIDKHFSHSDPKLADPSGPIRFGNFSVTID